MYTNIEIKGNNIIDIFYDKNGIKRMKKIPFKPTVGLETKDESEWKSFYDNKPLKLKQFDNIRDYRSYIREMGNIINIHGDVQPQYQYISEKYSNMNYDLNNIRVLALDIEVMSEDGFPDPEIAAWPITSIAVKDLKRGDYYVTSTKSYDKIKNRFDFDPKTIYFKRCKDDSGILIWLTKLFKMLKPDAITGWNCDNFDVPYIINRFDYIFDDENEKKKLSPLGQVYTEKITSRDFRSKIGGISVMDYMKMYKKYIFTPRESYKLDFIAETELKQTKLDYSEYDDLNDLWKRNPQMYIDYNIYDVELIHLLDQKLKLFELCFLMAYKTNILFNDVLGTIKPWDIMLYNNLKKKKIMVPPRKNNENVKFAGAYVKEPVCKIYDWVVSFDLNSLYPHLHQMWNISPETLVKNVSENVTQEEISKSILNQEIKPKEGMILAGNGRYFEKNKIGIIPKLLRELYTERSEIKKNMLNEEQNLVYIEDEIKRRGL